MGGDGLAPIPSLGWGWVSSHSFPWVGTGYSSHSLRWVGIGNSSHSPHIMWAGDMLTSPHPQHHLWLGCNSRVFSLTSRLQFQGFQSNVQASVCNELFVFSEFHVLSLATCSPSCWDGDSPDSLRVVSLMGTSSGKRGGRVWRSCRRFSIQIGKPSRPDSRMRMPAMMKHPSTVPVVSSNRPAANGTLTWVKLLQMEH